MDLSMTEDAGACIKSDGTGAKSCISASYTVKLSKTSFSAGYSMRVLPFCFQTWMHGEILVNLFSQYYALVN